MHDAINAPITAGGVMIDLDASIGVCLARRDDTPERLVARADVAMYESKRRSAAAGPVIDEESLESRMAIASNPR
jgi:GGDEF domain-containing protein